MSRKNYRHRILSLLLVIIFTAEILPVWAIPQTSEPLPVHAKGRAEHFHPAIEKLLPSPRNGTPSFPGHEGTQHLFPDPHSQGDGVAQTDLPEDKTSDSDTPRAPQPEKTRFPVPERSPSPSPTDESSSREKDDIHKPAREERRTKRECENADRDEAIHVKPNCKPKEVALHQPASVELLPSCKKAPIWMLTRQCRPDGDFIRMGQTVNGVDEGQDTDHRIYLQKRFPISKGATSKEISYDFVSPDADNNLTDRGSAASVQWKYSSVGQSASKFDAQYRLEIRVWDNRHPQGYLAQTSQGQMHLNSLSCPVGVSARDLGLWRVEIREDGQASSTQFNIRKPLAFSHEGFARVTHCNTVNYPDKKDFRGFDSDQGFFYQKKYKLPTQTKAFERCIRWIWQSRSAHCDRIEMSTTYQYLPGQGYTLVSRVFDPAYPKGRIYAQSSGTEPLSEFKIVYGEGLPAGDVRFEERVDDKLQQTRRIHVSPVVLKTESLLGRISPETGDTQFINEVQTDRPLPNFRYCLKILKVSDGTVYKVIRGYHAADGHKTAKFGVYWDNKMADGQPVPVGSGVDTELCIDLDAQTSRPSTTARSIALAAPANAATANAAARPVYLYTISGIGTGIDTGSEELGFGIDDQAIFFLNGVEIHRSSELPSLVKFSFFASPGDTLSANFDDVFGFGHALNPVMLYYYGPTKLTQQVHPGGIAVLDHAPPGRVTFATASIVIAIPPPPQEEEDDEDPGTSGGDPVAPSGDCGCGCDSKTFNSPVSFTIRQGTGAFRRAFVDLGFSTRGIPIAIGRHYVSELAHRGAAGWRWNFEDRLVFDFNSEIPRVFHFQADGDIETFFGDASKSTFEPAPEVETITDHLERLDANTFRLVHKDHSTTTYQLRNGADINQPGAYAVIRAVADKNGNKNSFVWNDHHTQLLKILGPTQQQFLKLDWRDGHLCSVSDHTGRTVRYTYGNALGDNCQVPLLTDVFQPGGIHYSYSYYQPQHSTRVYLLDTKLNDVLQEKAVAAPGGWLDEATHWPDHTLALTMRSKNGVQTTSSLTWTGSDVETRTSTNKLMDNMIVQTTETNGQENRQTKFEYDDKHNLVKHTDPKGHITRYTYDSRHNVTKIIDAAGNPTTMVYDSGDNLLSVEDAHGNKTQYAYDQHSNLLSVVDPLQHRSSLTYDENGLVTSATDQLGHTQTFKYNQFGYLRELTLPPDGQGLSQATWKLETDSLGRVTRRIDPLHQIYTSKYDERDHIIERTFPAVTAYSRQDSLERARLVSKFDERGLLQSTTSVDGLVTRFEYDLGHKLVAVYEPGKARPTRITYNSLEQVTAYTNNNGVSTQYLYNRFNELTQKTYANGDTETYSYDSNGNLVTWDRPGQQVQYSYDDNDRLKNIDCGATNDHIALGYNEIGQVVTMTDNSGTTSYAYTPNYNLSRIQRPNARALDYYYDGGDRLSRILDPEGTETLYGYSDRNELISATRDNQVVQYQHDLLGRVTQTRYPNGVACSNHFSERNQLLRRDYTRGSNPLLTLKYDFNQVGQRVFEEKITAQGTSVKKFGYDNQRHLTNSKLVQGQQTTYHTYSFDDNDNIVKKDGVSFEVNQVDQLTRAGSVTLGYNSAGQAISVSPKNLQFAYNDQLKSVSFAGTSVSMLYDGNGQRVGKTVNGQTSTYLWDGGEILKEYNSSGSVRAEYLLGLGRDAIKTDGSWKFYLKDIQGSTLGLTDSSGQMIASWSYDDYGEATQTSGQGVYNPFLYTGQEFDSELGLYHLRARHYSPSLGKFLARDPIGYGGGANLYAYCGGDPINFKDPSGQIALAVNITNIMQEQIYGDLLFTAEAGWITIPGRSWFVHPTLDVYYVFKRCGKRIGSTTQRLKFNSPILMGIGGSDFSAGVPHSMFTTADEVEVYVHLFALDQNNEWKEDFHTKRISVNSGRN